MDCALERETSCYHDLKHEQRQLGAKHSDANLKRVGMLENGIKKNCGQNDLYQYNIMMMYLSSIIAAMSGTCMMSSFCCGMNYCTVHWVPVR